MDSTPVGRNQKCFSWAIWLENISSVCWTCLYLFFATFLSLYYFFRIIIYNNVSPRPFNKSLLAPKCFAMACNCISKICQSCSLILWVLLESLYCLLLRSAIDHAKSAISAHTAQMQATPFRQLQILDSPASNPCCTPGILQAPPCQEIYSGRGTGCSCVCVCRGVSLKALAVYELGRKGGGGCVIKMVRLWELGAGLLEHLRYL